MSFPLLHLITCGALVAAAVEAFSFGRGGFEFGSGSCSSPDGRQGTCRAAIDCPQLVKALQESSSGQAALSCVQPCHINHRNQLEVCCFNEPKFSPLLSVSTSRPVASTSSIIFGRQPRRRVITRRPVGVRVVTRRTTTPTTTPPSTTTPPPTPRPTPAVQCGIAGEDHSSGIESNIAQGQDSGVARWPWMTLLGIRNASGPRWTCGGALLDDRHVLTAAHCAANASTMVVRLGEHDISTTADGAHQDLAVRRSVAHPGYHGRQNDIAILELATPVKLSKQVGVICLPDPAVGVAEGKHGQVAGWGRIAFGAKTSSILQETVLKIVNTAECEAHYHQLHDFSHSFPGGFNGTKLCAADELMRGSDACQGDSGGPLMLLGRHGTFSAVGVVSNGVGCGNPEYPGVYTRVASYLDWIQEVIKASSSAEVLN